MVTFAPLYCANRCVNRCAYCGFRADNAAVQRRVLSFEEIEREARVLAGELGHKRIVAVYGEHPSTGADYIAESMRRIYGVKVKVRNGRGEIRRVNVNAAPMSIADLAKIREAGIGTFQVFQETYHHETYAAVHPAGTVKGDFGWRLYALHRAMEAGIDDVAIGALFGLYDWRFEVMGMLFHALDLERRFGIGPHTVSVPRIEPAVNTTFGWLTHRVDDADFKRLDRRAAPLHPLRGAHRHLPGEPRAPAGGHPDVHAARRLQPHRHRRLRGRDGPPAGEAGSSSCWGTRGPWTRSSASSPPWDTSPPSARRATAAAGPGKKIMTLLRTGKEGCFCKLNAVLTFQEWLEDFGSPETRRIGEAIIEKEMAEIRQRARPRDFTPALVQHPGGVPRADQGRRTGPLLLTEAAWSIGQEKDFLGSRTGPRSGLLGGAHPEGPGELPPRGYRVHPGMIRAFAMVKKACCQANAELGLLEPDKAAAIIQACDEVQAGGRRWPTSFPWTRCRAGPAPRRT